MIQRLYRQYRSVNESAAVPRFPDVPATSMACSGPTKALNDRDADRYTEQLQAGTAPPATNRSRRTRLVALAAVPFNRSGTPTLRNPARRPWATQFTATLRALRALPGPSALNDTPRN